jgi:hypothetical protein
MHVKTLNLMRKFWVLARNMREHKHLVCFFPYKMAHATIANAPLAIINKTEY